MRKHPILLKDGDHIGVRILDEATSALEDDYQTEADRIAGEEFRIMTEQKRKEAEEEAKLRGTYRGGDNAAVRICLDDEEEER